MSPELSSQSNPENQESEHRPKDLFEINSTTTDVICCIHGEIASPSLVSACRKKHLDQVSCLAGGITGLSFYLRHTVSNADEVLAICHPQFQLPEFKNKIAQHIKEDAGTDWRDYYQTFLKSTSIQTVNIIAHEPRLVESLRKSDFYHYLVSCFPQVSLFSDYNELGKKYHLSLSEIATARSSIKAKAVLIY